VLKERVQCLVRTSIGAFQNDSEFIIVLNIREDRKEVSRLEETNSSQRPATCVEAGKTNNTTSIDSKKKSGQEKAMKQLKKRKGNAMTANR
jgi:hypothetical protein